MLRKSGPEQPFRYEPDPDGWECDDLARLYSKCRVDVAGVYRNRTQARDEVCSPYPGARLTALERKIVIEGGEFVRFDGAQWIFTAFRKRGLRRGKLAGPVMEKLSLQIRSGAMPDEAAVIERVSEASFWKAFGAGITASRFSAEKGLFNAVMMRLIASGV
jgi:hypothetical protein